MPRALNFAEVDGLQLEEKVETSEAGEAGTTLKWAQSWKARFKVGVLLACVGVYTM